jgi:hypothetical protein
LYELLLLTKSGREITVGSAQSDEDAKKLAETAQQLLAGLRQAQEQNHLLTVQNGPTVYWILPGEVEGMSLFQVNDDNRTVLNTQA